MVLENIFKVFFEIKKGMLQKFRGCALGFSLFNRFLLGKY